VNDNIHCYQKYPVAYESLPVFPNSLMVASISVPVSSKSLPVAFISLPVAFKSLPEASKSLAVHSFENGSLPKTRACQFKKWTQREKYGGKWKKSHEYL